MMPKKKDEELYGTLLKYGWILKDNESLSSIGFRLSLWSIFKIRIFEKREFPFIVLDGTCPHLNIL